MERVFPLPLPIRNALIDKFCPPMYQQSAKKYEANKDCLIRPYLGRLKYGSGNYPGFSLRNFRLHADEIMDLGLDASELCTSMARALAVLHWHTKIDGEDIEFVIGSSPLKEKVVSVSKASELSTMAPYTSTYDRVQHKTLNFTKRVTSLWMLDFDACSDIAMDSNGVYMAVKAFIGSNMYCPKPHNNNAFIASMWSLFSERYVEYSDYILEDVLKTTGLKHLPREFIEKVSSETARQQEARSMRSASASGSGTGSFGSMRRARMETSQSSTGSMRDTGSHRVYMPSRGGSWRGDRHSDVTIHMSAFNPVHRHQLSLHKA